MARSLKLEDQPAPVKADALWNPQGGPKRSGHSSPGGRRQKETTGADPQGMEEAPPAQTPDVSLTSASGA